MTVASLVPAATDLIIGMGSADKLVGVSNYDPARPETANLPRVGDYRTIDWEQIADLKPAVLIVQFRPDKMPPDLEEHAASYSIQIVNVRLDRLPDIFHAIGQIGDSIGEPQKAREATDRLQKQLDIVRTRVANRPPVSTYLSHGGDPLEAVAAGNFLDDLLTLAGGENALGGPRFNGNSYPTIDREQLRALNPQVAINLLPAASPQVVGQAKAFWASMGEMSVVQSGEVHYLTDEYLLWPGMSVGKIAERLADELHPETKHWTPKPATQQVEGSMQRAEAKRVSVLLPLPVLRGRAGEGAARRTMSNESNKLNAPPFCLLPSALCHLRNQESA